MMYRATILHLRVPFSFFLLPVFLFALSVSSSVDPLNGVLTFFILHLLLYPASNGYNSYFDKDEDSIGGLEHPPPVNKQLYNVSLLLDAVAVLLGLSINILFAVMLIIYGLVSKAYSHPAIRLKKYPWISWGVAGFFQGFFTFCMAYVGINGAGLEYLQVPVIWMGASLTSVMLWGSYPLTQIYQHKEDGRRGDQTLSILLGIDGTFYFAGVFLLFTGVGFAMYYLQFFTLTMLFVFAVLIAPVLLFFVWWYLQVAKDKALANYRNAMRMNMISGVCLNLVFFYQYIWLNWL